MSATESIVFLYGPTWDAPAQVSKQHLARYWAGRGRKVLYVEAPFHPLSLASRPGEVARMWRRYRNGPIEAVTNCYVQSYPAFYPYRARLPFAGTRWMLEANAAIARRRLASLCRTLEIERPLVLVATATALPLLECLSPSLVLYHCSDDYTRVSSFPESFDGLERELAQLCDLVICTAETLREAKSGLHPFTRAVSNGADIDHFAGTQAEGTAPAGELARFDRPLIGYVGTVFEWIDQKMVLHAAQTHPEWSFVFIGPVTTDVGRLRRMANIHFLGPRPYEDLPGYLRGFDVAIMPFVVDDVTLRASPIKFYEYLASGLPVVATRLPDLEPFEELVHLVDAASEAERAIQAAIDDDTPARRQARMLESQSHSWDARFAQIDRLIDEALDRKGVAA